ncbi:Uncharacterized protein DAT39_000373, partial [Clarias magur]
MAGGVAVCHQAHTPYRCPLALCSQRCSTPTLREDVLQKTSWYLYDIYIHYRTRSLTPPADYAPLFCKELQSLVTEDSGRRDRKGLDGARGSCCRWMKPNSDTLSPWATTMLKSDVEKVSSISATE